jgi:hypothetical protein
MNTWLKKFNRLSETEYQRKAGLLCKLSEIKGVGNTTKSADSGKSRSIMPIQLINSLKYHKMRFITQIQKQYHRKTGFIIMQVQETKKTEI